MEGTESLFLPFSCEGKSSHPQAVRARSDDERSCCSLVNTIKIQTAEQPNSPALCASKNPHAVLLLADEREEEEKEEEESKEEVEEEERRGRK